MKQNELNHIYEKMTTTSEMDERILKNAVAGRKRSRQFSMKTAGILVAAAFAVVCIAQVPSVSTNAKKYLQPFTNVFHLGDSEVEMTGEYIHINSKGTNQEGKYKTVAEIEKLLGISLLKSDASYEKEDNLFTYTPYLSKDGGVYGAMIQDDFYALGDLENIKIETFDSVETGNNIICEPGEQYKSPIAMQISIRTDQESGADYHNGELSYAGNIWDLSSDAETYEIKSLNTKAVLDVVKTDGIISWKNLDGKVEHCAEAVFVYEGIEYYYFGDVSIEVMKEFLEGLSY